MKRLRNQRTREANVVADSLAVSFHPRNFYCLNLVGYYRCATRGYVRAGVSNRRSIVERAREESRDAERQGECLIDALRFLGSCALLGAPRNFSWRCAHKKGTTRFRVESFPLSRAGEKKKQLKGEKKRERERERETREKRDRERQTGRRSKPTHLECKSAGKKNKLGGSNNKEICFSSNTHTHTHIHTRARALTHATHTRKRTWLGLLSSSSLTSPLLRIFL